MENGRCLLLLGRRCKKSMELEELSNDDRRTERNDFKYFIFNFLYGKRLTCVVCVGASWNDGGLEFACGRRNGIKRGASILMCLFKVPLGKWKTLVWYLSN